MIRGQDLRPLEALMKRLAMEPWSLYRAHEYGDDKYFGYSSDSTRLDNLQDIVNNFQYTFVKINAGKKPVKKPQPVTRPSVEKFNNHTPASLDDVGDFFRGA